MNLRPAVIFIVTLIFGFLLASTIYFYSLSLSPKERQSETISDIYSGVHPEIKNQTNAAIEAATKPAEPKLRLSYPANTYAVQPKESLYSIASKLKITATIIKSANAITDENHLQAGQILTIPVVGDVSNKFRLAFLLNEAAINELSRTLSDTSSSEAFDPVNAAKQASIGYFGLKATNDFQLVSADLSKGEALVKVESELCNCRIGMIQPKGRGEKAIWVMMYIEDNGKK